MRNFFLYLLLLRAKRYGLVYAIVFLSFFMKPGLFAEGDLNNILRKISFEEEIPSWMKEQIKSDLEPFKDGFTREDLDAFMHSQEEQGNKFYLVRFKIENQKVSQFHFPTEHSGILARIQIVTESLRQILDHFQIPDVDFIVSMLDCLDGVNFPVPVCVFSNNPNYSPNLILIPDFEALSGNENYLREVRIGNALYPWPSKINRAVWRGAMTGYTFGEILNPSITDPPRMGGVFVVENFLEFPRTAVVSLSLRYPHLIDARYTFLSQCSDCERIYNTYKEYFDQIIPVHQHLRYKYQVLIDGNTTAYSRAYWQLFSNSVILKQVSSAKQWYYQAIYPFVHYIPVAWDLSDLPSVIEWTIEHDQEAKYISDNAQNFAHDNLTHEKVMLYMYVLLKEYANLQK